ncbi:DUF6603 domain-containing protein [Kitasatospora sp. NPDC001309]|uniref:DUF6603 domain-containing protein n=1 Tax=Kitasatospora sp. NPDC001309 TaxID=3364013 RepID=UPI0036783426
MGLSVAALRARIEASDGGAFTLGAADLDLPTAGELFQRHLGAGTLNLARSVALTEELSVAGELLLSGAATPLPALVWFATDRDPDDPAAGDDDEALVTGLQIDVSLPDFTVPAGHLDRELDPAVLRTVGFDTLHLLLDATAAIDDDRTDDHARPRNGIGAEFPLPGAGPRQRGYAVGFCPEQAGCAWSLAGDFADVPLRDLADLAVLGPGLGAGDFAIPEEFGRIGPLAMSGLSVTFHPADQARGITAAIVSAGVRIELDTTFDLFPGALGVSGLFAEFTVTHVGRPRVRSLFGGTLTLAGDTEAHAEVRLPDFRAVARLLAPVPLAPLAAAYLPGLGLPELTVSELRFEGTAGKGAPAFGLDLSVEGPWEVLPGRVALTDLDLALTVDGDGWTGELETAWQLGGGQVGVSAEHQDGVWRFLGQATGLTPADLFGVFEADVPALFDELELLSLSVEFDGSGEEIALGGALAFPIGEADAVLTLTTVLTRRPTGGGYEKQVTGLLTVVVPGAGTEEPDGGEELLGEDLRQEDAPAGVRTAGPRTLVFAVDYREDATGTTVTGTWSSPEGVRPTDLVAALGIDLPRLPEALEPALTALAVRYDSATGQVLLTATTEHTGWVYATRPGSGQGKPRRTTAAARVRLDARASGLPLVGDAVPPGSDLALPGLAVTSAPEGWNDQQARALNTLLDGLDGAAERRLPRFAVGEAARPGVAVQIELSIGGEPQDPLVLPVTSPPGRALTARGPIAARAIAARAQEDGSARELGVVLGPVRLHRLGVAVVDGRLVIALDATMAVGPLTVDLLGLGFGLDTDWSLTPTLRGASLALERTGPPRVVIAGAFTRIDAGPEFEPAFAAAGRIEIQDLIVLQLAGSWARNKAGWDSVFGYAELVAGRNRINGLFTVGPVTFTGVVLGFGVNSTVRLPATHEVSEFPFVKRLGAAPGEPGGEVEKLSPTEALDRLVGQGGWVTPAQGQYWVAGGMEFTVYRFIQARAVALVEWGPAGWKAVLAGSTSLALPPTRGAGSTAARRGEVSPHGEAAPHDGAAPLLFGKPLGQVVVDFVFAYDSALGRFSMDTVIAEGSYLLDPQARLTGGISLYVWGKSLPGVPKGFVLTAGGYHPRFRVPAHYPRPPRIGWLWERGPVSIRAEAYAALTDGAFMIGGELAAVYDNGHGINLRAWFTAYVHALVQWKPFYADLALGLRIGVAATVKVLFVRIRVSLEVGVDLQLWLPPIGGRAKVKVWFISFTLGFGADRKGAPAADWEEFQLQLPAPSRAALKQGGELPDVTEAETAARQAAAAPELVRIDGFTTAVESALPASRITLNGDLFAGSDTARIDIRPMKLTGVVCEQIVEILDEQGRRYGWQEAGWEITASREGLPQALWGRPLANPNQALDQDGLVDGCLTGLTIDVPGPTRQLGVGPVPSAALDVEGLPPGRMPLRDGSVAGPAPVFEEDGVGVITRTLTGAAAERTAVHDALAALGLAPGSDGPLDRTAELLGHSLTDAPMLTEAQR